MQRQTRMRRRPQVCFTLLLQVSTKDELDAQVALDIFKYDPEYTQHEQEYEVWLLRLLTRMQCCAASMLLCNVRVMLFVSSICIERRNRQLDCCCTWLQQANLLLLLRCGGLVQLHCG